MQILLRTTQNTKDTNLEKKTSLQHITIALQVQNKEHVLNAVRGTSIKAHVKEKPSE